MAMQQVPGCSCRTLQGCCGRSSIARSSRGSPVSWHRQRLANCRRGWIDKKGRCHCCRSAFMPTCRRERRPTKIEHTGYSAIFRCRRSFSSTKIISDTSLCGLLRSILVQVALHRATSSYHPAVRTVSLRRNAVTAAIPIKYSQRPLRFLVNAASSFPGKDTFNIKEIVMTCSHKSNASPILN